MASASHKINNSNKSIFLQYLALIWITGIFPPKGSKSKPPFSYNSFSIYSGSAPLTSILFIATIIWTLDYFAILITSNVYY